MLRIIKSIFTNRIGWFLSVSHLCLAIYDFSDKKAQEFDANNCTLANEWSVTGYLIAGRFFHFTYESLIHKWMFFLDLPAVILSGFVMMPVSYFLPTNICAYTLSWIYAFILLVLTSLQWLLVGYLLQLVFDKNRRTHQSNNF